MVQRAPAKKLAGALLSRGYQTGRPQLRIGESLEPVSMLSLHHAQPCQALDFVSCMDLCLAKCMDPNKSSVSSRVSALAQGSNRLHICESETMQWQVLWLTMRTPGPQRV